jgi:tetratricopeptide (TPR) repeat protein
METAFYRVCVFTLLVVGCLEVDSLHAQDGPAKVDLVKHEYSDPAIWIFKGVDSFSVRQIKSAVTSSIDFLKASHPNSKDEELLKAIQVAVVRGYHHRGYASVSVKTQIDRQRKVLQIQVAEGPKFRAGGIQVTGENKLSVERLIHWCQHEHPAEQLDIPLRANANGQATQLRDPTGRLLEPTGNDLAAVKEPNTFDPVWELGGSRSLLSEQQGELKKYLAQGFEDQGFYHTKFDFKVVAEPRSKTLILNINVQQEGPQAIVKKLELNGLAFNSKNELLNYLKLSIGQPISGQRCKQIKQALQASGRFLRHSALAVAPNSDSSDATLYIDVREFSGSPTLSKSLSEAQKVGVSFSNWVSNWPKSKYDLVFELKITKELRDNLRKLKTLPFIDEIPVGTTRLTVSPNGGCIFQLLPDRNGPDNVDEFHLALSSNGMIKIDGPLSDFAQFAGERESSFFISCVLKGMPKNPKDHKVSLSFGLGLGPIKKGHVFSFAPATAVEALSHIDRLGVHTTDNEVQLIADNSEVVLHRDTKEPKLFRLIVGPEGIEGAEITVRPIVGAYEKTRNELLRIVKHRGVQPRKASSSEFLGMLGGLAIDWMKANSDEFASNDQECLLRLLDSSIWLPIHAQISNDEFKENFHIPHSDEFGSKFGMHMLYQLVRLAFQSEDTRSFGQAASMLMPMLTQVISFKSPLFAYGSPPWIINRHQTLELAGGGQPKSLYALLHSENQIGPLGCLYGMALTSSATGKKRFAEVGLEAINHFDIDRTWLLDHNSLTRTVMEVAANAFANQLPKDVKRFLEALGGRPLSEADVAAILEPLDPDKKMTDRMLADFTTGLWSYWFQPIVETAFQSKVWSNETYLTNLMRRGDRRRALGLTMEAVRDFKFAQQLFDRIVKGNDAKSTDAWVAKFRGSLHFAIARCVRMDASRAERLQALASIQQSILAYEAGFGGFQIGTPTKESRSGLRELSDVYESKAQFEATLNRPNEVLASLDSSAQIYDKTVEQIPLQDEKEALGKKLAKLAWEQATSSSAVARDGSKAIKNAQRSVELLGKRNAFALATLAAAHATHGDFKQAVEIQRQALAVCNAADQPVVSARLKLYSSSKPFHQTPSRIAAKGKQFE